MASTLNRLVNPRRVRVLLECYGADPAAWPAEERHAAKILLERDPELQRLRDQALHVDAVIQNYHARHRIHASEISALADSIMQSLPSRTEAVARPVRTPRSPAWLTGIAASLMLIGLVFIFPRSGPVQEGTSPPITQSADTSGVFAAWAWEDVTGEVMENDVSESDIFPLYALVAPELIDDER